MCLERSACIALVLFWVQAPPGEHLPDASAAPIAALCVHPLSPPLSLDETHQGARRDRRYDGVPLGGGVRSPQDPARRAGEAAAGTEPGHEELPGLSSRTGESWLMEVSLSRAVTARVPVGTGSCGVGVRVGVGVGVGVEEACNRA